MTEPTKAELNEAVARWDGWQRFPCALDPARPECWSRSPAQGWTHRPHPPDYLTDTPESRAVAWRLLVALVRMNHDTMLTARSGGFGVSPGTGISTQRCGNPIEAVYRAAWAARVIGSKRG